MPASLKDFLRDESGATVVEYAVLLGVLSLVIVGGFGSVANSLEYLWGDNNSRLNSAWR